MSQHNKGRIFETETLTPDETHRLLAACNHGPSGARNRALLVILGDAGLRIGEAIQLRVSDIDLVTGAVKVRAGKRTRHQAGVSRRSFKPRTSVLTVPGLAVVRDWIVRREQLGIAATAPLLCTLKGAPLWTSYVRALCQRLARKAKVGKRVHPHCFRHSFASDLARRAVPMNVIQAALGHKSLATTSTYLAHVAPDDVVQTLHAARDADAA